MNLPVLRFLVRLGGNARSSSIICGETVIQLSGWPFCAFTRTLFSAGRRSSGSIETACSIRAAVGDEHADAAALVEHAGVDEKRDALEGGGGIDAVERRELVDRRHLRALDQGAVDDLVLDLLGELPEDRATVVHVHLPRAGSLRRLPCWLFTQVTNQRTAHVSTRRDTESRHS